LTSFHDKEIVNPFLPKTCDDLITCVPIPPENISWTVSSFHFSSFQDGNLCLGVRCFGVSLHSQSKVPLIFSDWLNARYW
jgi:hypothetical protein